MPMSRRRRCHHRRRRRRHGREGELGRGCLVPREEHPTLRALDVAEAVHGRVPDGRVVVFGEGDVDEGVEVGEDLGVAGDGEGPGAVDVVAVLALSAGVVDGGRGRAPARVARRLDDVEVLRVGVLARLRDEVEVGEDVVAGAATDP